MASQAISAFGVALKLGDGVAHAGVGISNATNATPIIVTAPHGVPVGDITTVTITGVTGNAGANGTWIAESLTSTTLRLRGSVGTGAYVSGGSLVVTDTYTTIAEMTNAQDVGLSTVLIDVTSHDAQNGYGSSIPTFLRGNTMRVDLNLVPDHPTHDELTGLLAVALSRQSRRFLVVFPDASRTAWAFAAFVVADRTQAPVAGALTASASLEIDGAMLLSAA